MHIPENYLSPSTCAVMAAAMVPVWAHAVKKVNNEMPKDKIPLIGVGAAFSFLGMMFNVPLIGGTTGHAVGGTLVALLFGPDAACLAVSVALLLQAVIFGDGGILSFGANCFNIAFMLPYLGYAIYKIIVKLSGGEKAKNIIHYVAAAIGSYIGLNAAALFTGIEFGIQPLLFTDEAGNALYCPYDLSVSIPAMTIPHLAVAGFVEAAFTVAIYAFVKKTSPSLIYNANELQNKNISKKGKTPIFALISLLIVATPLGLLAAGSAWGEWSSEEIAKVTENGTILGYTPKGIQNGWSLSALISDYSLAGVNEKIAYILSAIIGVSLLIIIFKLIAIPMKGKNNDS